MPFLNPTFSIINSLYNQRDSSGLKYCHLLAACTPFSWNQTLGLEHRGLHFTDKRFTELTGIVFIAGMPYCSVFELFTPQIRRAIEIAISKRGPKASKLTVAQYQLSLISRCVRLQIENSSLRKDWLFKRIGERLRMICLPKRRAKRFMGFASDPMNKPAVVTMLTAV